MTDEKKAPKFLIGLRAVLVVIVAILTIIAIITHLQKKRDTRPFNYRTFPESIMITNGTDFRADTIAMILAYDIFDIDEIDLKIYYLPEQDDESEIEFFGFVQQLPFGEHKYLILLNRKMSFEKMKEVLSHEFVHIDQYERGDLIVSGKTYIWKGEPGEITVYDTTLPFEREAFKSQYNVKKELDRYLYE